MYKRKTHAGVNVNEITILKSSMHYLNAIGAGRQWNDEHIELEKTQITGTKNRLINEAAINSWFGTLCKFFYLHIT